MLKGTVCVVAFVLFQKQQTYEKHVGGLAAQLFQTEMGEGGMEGLEVFYTGNKLICENQGSVLLNSPARHRPDGSAGLLSYHKLMEAGDSVGEGDRGILDRIIPLDAEQ